MGAVLDILIINIVMVIMIDHLHIQEDFLFKPIWKMMSKLPYNGWGFKPFSCSLCMSWWAGLLYIIITHHLTLLYIMIVLLMAVFNFTINDLIVLIKEYWSKLMDKII